MRGAQLHLTVNQLAHHALATQLAPCLAAGTVACGTPSRVVVVASAAARLGRFRSPRDFILQYVAAACFQSGETPPHVQTAFYGFPVSGAQPLPRLDASRPPHLFCINDALLPEDRNQLHKLLFDGHKKLQELLHATPTTGRLEAVA